MAASAVLAPAVSHPRPTGLAKRFVHAPVASRFEAASRELRRHQALIHETALVHGDLRSIGLGRADVLPFNA